jgi:hypothetical protein
MSSQLDASLTFLVSLLSMWVAVALLTEGARFFLYIRSIFKRSEDEKMIQEFIEALKPKDGPKE